MHNPCRQPLGETMAAPEHYGRGVGVIRHGNYVVICFAVVLFTFFFAFIPTPLQQYTTWNL